MRANEKMMKVISALLCLCMLVQNVPVMALAAAEDTLCAHHTGHTEACGYEEGLADCAFQCGECAAAAITQEPEETTVPETTEETVTETTEVTEPSTEATEPTEETEPEPVCNCETDDPACHATNCPCYEAPENPMCFCVEKCQEPNVWCDVCGFDSSRCGGEDTAATYEGCDHSVEATLGYVSGSSKTHSHEAEKYLLDGDPSTKWCGDFGDGFENYVIFTADGASILTSYTLTTGADTGSQFRHYRNWTAWTLYGSNSPDGNWDIIDQVTGANLPMGSNVDSDPFLVEPHTPYTYYKLEVNAIFAPGNPPLHQMADITIQKLSYPNGECDKCGEACPHGIWQEGNCVLCGTTCSHAGFEAGICTVCGTACSHNYIAGFCTACGMEHDHTGESFVNGVYPECGYACSHTDILSLQHEYGSDYISWRIVDGDPITYWYYYHPKYHTSYEVFSTVGPTVLKSYTLTVVSKKNEDLNWTSWTLYGSHNKNEGWVEIDQVVDTTLVVDSNKVSQMFMVEPHIPYPYYKLVPNDIATNDRTEYHQMAEFTITGYCFNNGTCTTCGYSHSEHSYTNGYCDVCFLKHDHTTENFTDGECAICHYICPHKAYDANRNCSVCGSACAHAEFENSLCKACGYECDHTTSGYEAGFCKLCGTEHDHTGEGYTNGVHTVCGYTCSHGKVLPLTYVSGSGAINNDTADKLFDHDSDSKWCADLGRSENYVIFSVEDEAVLKSYTLTTGNDTAEYPGRNWKDWTLYGSNSADGPWTQVQKVRSANFPEANCTPSQPIVVPKHAPYTHFKLVVTAIKGGSVQQMSELTASGSCIVDGVCTLCNFGCNTHDYADGFCKVCGTVCTHIFNTSGVCTVCDYSCSHEEILDLTLIAGSNDNARNLLDRSPGTMWDHPFIGDGKNWIEFTAGEAVVIKSYTLTTHHNASVAGQANWKNWTLFGRNGEEEWTEIHRVTDEKLPWVDNATTAPYVLSNPSPYTQFRLVVNAVMIPSYNVQQMADITVTGSYMRSGVCTECGYKCQNHVYSDGICKICSYVCPHTSFTGADCDICDYICPHANFGADCKCTVCKIECSHERGYTDGICNACKTACGHQKGYSETGFCNTCAWYEPAPQENGVYKISNAGQLYWFAQQVGKGNTGINGELTCNIDLKANSPTDGNWGSMGSTDHPYQGTLDGKGYTVDNVKIWEEEYVGFIRAIGTNGVVKNLGLGKQCSISGYEITGGICGKNDGLIEGCWYRGKLTGRGKANNSTVIGGTAGGIAGENNHTIRNCWFDGQMNETGDDGYYPRRNGGIVGDNNGGTVENCYNMGTLYGWTTYGGIVGLGGTVKHCYTLMPTRKVANNKECQGPDGIGSDTVINSYHEGGISRDTFSTGELAYKLQSGVEADKNSSELVWGQNLDNGKPRDDHPIQAFRGAPRVYQVTDCQNNTYYSNSSSNGRHRFGSDGKCICGTQCPHESTACMDQGNGSHNDICTLCGYVTATESHTFDPVTEQCECGAQCAHNFENGICTLCGKTNAPIVITQQPTNGEAKLGERYCVEVIAVGEGLQYQWYMKNAGSKSFSKSSVTDNTYDDVMTKARADREVYCVITDAHGNKVTTDTVKLICLPGEDLAITRQPKNASAKLNETFCVTVEAKGDGLKYQWYWRNKGSTEWNISGQKDNTYDDVMTSARHNREVKCVITDAWGNTAETDIATITGIPTATLAITRQPDNQSVALGEQFNVTFDAVGDGLKYQWYFQNAGTETWHTSAQKDNSYDDVMTEARHNRQLYCVVTDAWGNKVQTEPIVTIMASHQYDLAITSQPENASAKLGEQFCVTVEAQGDGLKYQWYWRNAGSENWVKSGQRDNTYDDEMTKERNHREVKCVITDMWGSQVESDSAIITGIPEVALAITRQPTDSYVAMGKRYCVTVEAQGDNLTYTWYFRNPGSTSWSKSGVKDNTYDDVMTKAREGREVYCVVTDALGNSITTDHAIIGVTK